MTALDARTTDPYDRLAPAYACLAASYDHDRWLARLLSLARKAGLRGERALDVACGTGSSTAPLVAHGFDVTAVDRSAGMLGVAGPRLDGRARLVAADMRELPRLGAFDLVTCLDDALNHLLSAADLQAALAGMARNLAPGGLLVFDLNTLATLRSVFSTDWASAETSPMVLWRGLGDPRLAPAALTHAEVTVLRPGEPADRVTVTERHHPLDAVLQSLWLTGLEPALVRGQHRGGRIGSEAPDEERHHKMVIFARRPVGLSTWHRAHGMEGGAR